jgi:hypothetical protein
MGSVAIGRSQLALNRALRVFPFVSWNEVVVSALASGIREGGLPCQLERPSPDVPAHSGRTA